MYQVWRFIEIFLLYTFRQPIQGVGKDNGAGTTTRKLISNKLLELLRIKGFAREFVTDIGKDMYHVVSYAFFGYTDIFQKTCF